MGGLPLRGSAPPPLSLPGSIPSPSGTTPHYAPHHPHNVYSPASTLASPPTLPGPDTPILVASTPGLAHTGSRVPSPYSANLGVGSLSHMQLPEPQCGGPPQSTNSSLLGKCAKGSPLDGCTNGSLLGGCAKGSPLDGCANGSLLRGCAKGSLLGGCAKGSLLGGYMSLMVHVFQS